MRLIDADAEILKIEAEIERTKERIKELEENRAGRSLYNVDEKIKDSYKNISDAKIEIKILKHYATAYDVGKVVRELEKKILENMECKFEADANMCGTSASRYSEEIHAYSKSIEIVKAGGINE